MKNTVFTQVDYRQFRDTLALHETARIRNRGYETVIFKGDEILAIMHAASIDETGQCYPATYYIRHHSHPQQLAKVA